VKVLVANRGEIAVRIIRGCRELGFGTVAVYSDADRTALHVRLADEAHYLGPSASAESYLRIDRLLDVARRSGARLVHPGYGFLAENDAFAQACVDAGLVFVGPTPQVIRAMGSKTEARVVARRAGVSLVPGLEAPLDAGAPDAAIAAAAADIGYPVLVKAVAGGGGKGMRLAASAEGLDTAVRLARSEAQAAFGDDRIYLERQLEAPRHIEVQVLGDADGTIVPFVERECSIQRRHQKVVEESPSPVLDEDQRREVTDLAVRVARAAGYTNAGTVEFLYADRQFYFLEMNTRLQVEHPTTEMVTGVDLVGWQLRIALGERVTLDPEGTVSARGHAIECRIYAEDPDQNFLPSPGLVRGIVAPGGPGIRDDDGMVAGFEIPVFYDSMISKLVAWGPDRALALARLRRALDEYQVVGVTTSLPFFRWLVRQPAFETGVFDTTFLDRVLAERQGAPFVEAGGTDELDAAIAVGLAAWFRAREGMAREAVSQWQRAARREAVGD